MAEKIYYSSQRDLDDIQGEIVEDVVYDENIKFDKEHIEKLSKGKSKNG